MRRLAAAWQRLLPVEHVCLWQLGLRNCGDVLEGERPRRQPEVFMDPCPAARHRRMIGRPAQIAAVYIYRWILRISGLNLTPRTLRRASPETTATAAASRPAAPRPTSAQASPNENCPRTSAPDGFPSGVSTPGSSSGQLFVLSGCTGSWQEKAIRPQPGLAGSYARNVAVPLPKPDIRRRTFQPRVSWLARSSAVLVQTMPSRTDHQERATRPAGRAILRTGRLKSPAAAHISSAAVHTKAPARGPSAWATDPMMLLVANRVTL